MEGQPDEAGWRVSLVFRQYGEGKGLKQAAEEIAGIGSGALPMLDRYLRSGGPDAQILAARALGLMKKYSPALVEIMASPDPRVRKAAADAIVKSGVPAGCRLFEMWKDGREIEERAGPRACQDVKKDIALTIMRLGRGRKQGSGVGARVANDMRPIVRALRRIYLPAPAHGQAPRKPLRWPRA